MFRNSNRPANRYLYSQVSYTYFHSKQAENAQWAERLECKGHLWATPGPYLRRSMLEILARNAADFKLPEIFWQTIPDMTFEDSDSSPAMSSADEETHGVAMANRCIEYATSERQRSERKEESDSSIDSDDEEYWSA